MVLESMIVLYLLEEEKMKDCVRDKVVYEDLRLRRHQLILIIPLHYLHVVVLGTVV